MMTIHQCEQWDYYFITWLCGMTGSVGSPSYCHPVDVQCQITVLHEQRIIGRLYQGHGHTRIYLISDQLITLMNMVFYFPHYIKTRILNTVGLSDINPIPIKPEQQSYSTWSGEMTLVYS